MSKEAQRYKIYINDKQLLLLSEEELANVKLDDHALALPYKGQQKSLFQYLDTLENSDRFNMIALYAADLKGLVKDLVSVLQNTPAAGGVIENPNKEILMIYRRQMWDLPKGKLDKEEDFESAALRECEEEVGLKNLKLTSKIGNTYHIYRDKKNLRCFKKTKWYYLQNLIEETAIPQLEEDIQEAKWIKIEEAMQLQPIHENIKYVLQKFMNLKSK